MFFKARYQLFLEILKINEFAISVALKIVIQKYFLEKKMSKKFANNIGKKTM
jgi:hypothetical protein